MDREAVVDTFYQSNTHRVKYPSIPAPPICLLPHLPTYHPAYLPTHLKIIVIVLILIIL